ncbi:MAG: type II toxin-antitoxin system VapC family toxin [Egibacteraceae bacterium]
MTIAERGPVVYDTGALVAADRGTRSMFALHGGLLDEARQIIVPAPVLTQAWRDGARQVRLVRLLRGCLVAPTSERMAKAAGELLGRAGAADAVDAIVVSTALRYEARVVTSDPDDLERLVRASGAGVPIPLIVV